MRYLAILIIFSLIASLLVMGCKKKEETTGETTTVGGVKSELVDLLEDDVVFAQWIEGEGEIWEEGKVVGITGEDVTIEWSDTFNKGDEPQVKKHYKKVVKQEPVDINAVEVGLKVLIQPEDKASWVHYQGEVIEVKKDKYTIKYHESGEEKTAEVDEDRLWKFR